MMNVETEKLVTWVRREAKQGNGLVTLTHQNVGGFGAALGRWPVSLEDPDEILVQIAQDVYRAACDDADGQQAPGPQQYIAHFYGERDLRTPANRMPFLVVASHQAALGPPSEGLATEPPTQSGFIGHIMRHSDTAWRNAWTITGHALGILERHASQVAQENVTLRQANFDLARGYEGLLSERHIRELAGQTALHERHERSQFYNRMWLLAPPVVGKLLGGSGAQRAPSPATPMLPAPPHGSPAVPPSGASVGASPPAPAMASAPASTDSLLAIQLRAFMDSISGEQLAALQGALSTEQFVALGLIYNSLPQAPEPPPPAPRDPAAPPAPPEGGAS